MLLNKNSTIPWFILVPEADVTDLLDLPASQLAKVMNECGQLSRWLKQHYNISRINFGALGNLVPQLHLHVVGRSINDACWPKPVWGNLDVIKNYSIDEINLIRQQLVTEYELVIGEDPGC